MPEHVVRRTARAILLDGADLLLFKRTRPGVEPYWTTVGGGFEAEDSCLEDTLRREVLEEIGGRLGRVSQVFVFADHGPDRRGPGLWILHLFLAELAELDPSLRCGPELDDPSRGTYELVRVPFTPAGIAAVNLHPPEVAQFLVTTCAALAASVHTAVSRPTSTSSS